MAKPINMETEMSVIFSLRGLIILGIVYATCAAGGHLYGYDSERTGILGGTGSFALIGGLASRQGSRLKGALLVGGMGFLGSTFLAGLQHLAFDRA